MKYKFENVIEESAQIILSGEISGITREEIGERFRNFFDKNKEKRVKKVYINISEIDYIDSIGIALLLKINREIKELGAEMLLVRPTNSVKKIFIILGLEKTLNFYENGVK